MANHINLSVTPVTIEQLASRRDMISMEAFGVASTLLQNVGMEAISQHRAHLPMFNKLIGLVHDTTGLINERIAALFPKKEHLDLSDLSGYTKDRNFLDFSGVRLPVPAGMSVHWVQYLDTLQEATDIAVKIYEEVLYPFELFIGQAINNPAVLGNSTFQHNVRVHDLNSIRKNLAAVRKNGSQAFMPYTKALRRNADWYEIQEKIDRLIKTQLQVPVELVQKTVNDIDESMSRLIKQMMDPNQQYRAAPEVISQMAELCTIIAEEVTFYSATVALNAAASTALEETRGILSKLKTA